MSQVMKPSSHVSPQHGTATAAETFRSPVWTDLQLGEPQLKVDVDLPDIEDDDDDDDDDESATQMPETPHGRPLRFRFSWRKLWRFAGPGWLMSLAYLDPGNLEANLQQGAYTRYSIVWVLWWATVSGLVLQEMSSRFGIVTGRDLAQAVREEYPRWVSITVYLMMELAVIGADVQVCRVYMASVCVPHACAVGTRACIGIGVGVQARPSTRGRLYAMIQTRPCCDPSWNICVQSANLRKPPHLLTSFRHLTSRRVRRVHMPCAGSRGVRYRVQPPDARVRARVDRLLDHGGRYDHIPHDRSSRRPLP